MTLEGTLFVTREPAAITEFAPIVTPWRRITPTPIQTFFSIMTLANVFKCLSDGSIECPTDEIVELAAIRTLSEIVIDP